MGGDEHHHVSVGFDGVVWDGGQRVNADGESPVVDVDQLFEPCWRKGREGGTGKW